MPKYQYKNMDNNRNGSISTPEHSYPKTARLDHYNSAEAQENSLKNNYEDDRCL